jgi:hypothetical protein
MASLNSQQAPVRPVQGTSQTGATQTAAQICVFNPESSPLCHQASKKVLEEKQLPITIPEICLPGESSLLFENFQESSAK